MENNDFSTLTAREIIELLERPNEDRRPLKAKLSRSAHVTALIQALQESKQELTKRIICDILGKRKAKTAVPALIECLYSPYPQLKDDAAEALGKIGNSKAGEPLLEVFIDEPRLWYAIALGAIKYRAAIPYLIEALKSSSSLVKGGAAWALGEMKALEARDPLIKASMNEQDEYAISRIREALETLG